MSATTQYFTLNNGVKMPVIGFGTWQVSQEDTEQAVLQALRAGYRCIDTAEGYQNEEQIARAIKASGIPREEIFIITKVWVQDHGYEQTKKAFADSLKRLNTDYVDLYLIHMPFGDIYSTWRAMEELYQEG